MNRRQIIVFFLGLFWLALAQAVERGALFRVTANGHTMHLFGTMHVGVKQFFPLEPQITEAVQNASTLALELDPDQSFFSKIRAIQKYGLLADGDACYAGLPPARRALLEQLERQAGLDPSAASRMKPVLLATMLGVGEYRKLGYSPELGTDQYLARLARKGNTRVLELESLGGQLALLDTLPRADQMRFLDETMNAMESGAQANEVRKVVDAWGSADQAALDGVADGIARDKSVSGSFARDVLLDGRNAGMADKLEKLLASEERTVAAVGVLHLLGKKGVPALLRERGLTVERVY